MCYSPLPPCLSAACPTETAYLCCLPLHATHVPPTTFFVFGGEGCILHALAYQRSQAVCMVLCRSAGSQFAATHAKIGNHAAPHLLRGALHFANHLEPVRFDQVQQFCFMAWLRAQAMARHCWPRRWQPRRAPPSSPSQLLHSLPSGTARPRNWYAQTASSAA